MSNVLPFTQGLSLFEENIRNRIALLEMALNMMSDDGVPELDLPVKHVFTDGVYVREMFIPKDTIIVGKIHKHDHLNYISKGKVTVLTKAGLENLEGPCSMISTAGTKRALYTHEDTIWTTVHANPDNEKDTDKLEEDLTVRSYQDLLPETLTKQIGEIS